MSKEPSMGELLEAEGVDIPGGKRVTTPSLEKIGQVEALIDALHEAIDELGSECIHLRRQLNGYETREWGEEWSRRKKALEARGFRLVKTALEGGDPYNPVLVVRDRLTSEVLGEVHREPDDWDDSWFVTEDVGDDRSYIDALEEASAPKGGNRK